MRKPMPLVAGLCLALGCTRDLSLPPPPAPPGAGSIAGRVVYAQPGTQTKLAAYGARVELVGTGRVTGADSAGRFLLDGIDFDAAAAAAGTEAQLLVQFDPGATGVPSRQRLLGLGAFSPRPGLQVSIGDVAVSENARVRGKLLRADDAGAGGHAGTVVYVPQGPFTTFTNDDGSFSLPELPEGSITLAAFRTGYASLVLDAVSLRAGEDLALRDLSLSPLTGGGTGDPGAISGTVTFEAAPAPGAVTTVTAVDGAGTLRGTTAGLDGAFAITGVLPGVYQVTAVRDGFLAARAPNVAVAPGGDTVVTGLRLAAVASGATCVAGAPCQPAGAANLCKLGVASCAAGTRCSVTGNAVDGIACGAGLLCRAGACVPPCAAGRICAPANACHVGVVVCAADGTASCADIGAQLPDGAACGPDLSCSGGACLPCAGASCGPCSVECVPANPCHVGARACSAGTAGTCVDTGLFRGDGVGCGTNLVCLGGACAPCAAGASCETGTSRCKNGLVSCATGSAVCVEGSSKADGTPCGSGDACRAGACLPAGGQVATLYHGAGSPSTLALQIATNGDLYFSDYYGHTVKRLAAGATAPEVIAGIQGTPGISLDNQPATSATLDYPWGLALDENDGLLYVADYYSSRIRAVQLGGSRWIVAVAGGGNQPAPGYGDGGPAIAATLGYPETLALGDEGGQKVLFFHDGSHGRFRKVNLSTGLIAAWDVPTSCSAPVAVSGCAGTSGCSIVPAGSGGIFVSGQLCGTAVTGSPYGVVRLPVGGGPPVHVLGRNPGLTTEGGYARTTALADSPGIAVDAAGNLYVASFTSNTVRRVSPTGVVRTVAGTGAAGTSGDGGRALDAAFDGPAALLFNRGGASPGIDAYVAEARGNVLRRIVGLGAALYERGSIDGTAATTAVVGRAPDRLVGATLVDPQGAALIGFELTAEAVSTPAGTLLQSTASTDVNGLAAFPLRVGLLPGPYAFQAGYRDLYGAHVPGSPARFTVAATAPADGTILSLVNEDRVQTFSGVPGFGPTARVSYPSAVAVAPDGTVYVCAEGSQRIVAVTRDGAIRVVAGNGTAGFFGDGGLAISAELYYPWGVALDATAAHLYVGDWYNHRVRVVDLATGIISTLAGNGTGASTGDGGPASAAQVNGPQQVHVHGGRLYVSESDRVRVIDLTATPPTISTLFRYVDCNTAVAFSSCSTYPGCGFAHDGAGNLYLSAYACGTALGSSVPAILRWDGSALSLVAGHVPTNSDDSDGAPASLSSYTNPPGIAFGPGGRLLVADIGGHRVRRIDLSGAQPVNRRWFGSGAYGFAGDYVSTLGADGLAVQVYAPAAIASTPDGHVVLADYYNHMVRLVWNPGPALP